MSMGFRERDAKRALRMSNQDVQSAIDFLIEQKAKRDQKREDDLCRRNEIMLVIFLILLMLIYLYLYTYLVQLLTGSKRSMV